MSQKYCSGCGNQVMQTMLVCPQCGERSFSDSPVAVKMQQHVASAQTNVSPVPLSPQISSLASSVSSNYAGFWERLAASLIDVIVVVIFSFIAGIFLGYGMMALGISAVSPRGEAFLSLTGIVVVIFYFAAMESGVRGATFGKRWMNLRVVDLNYQQISTWQGIGRYFGRWVSTLTIFIGYLIQPFTTRRQTLHDMMCSTLVVHSKTNPKPKSGMEVFATIIVSIVLIAILLLLVRAGQ